MAIRVFCEGCNKVYKVPEALSGKRGKCPMGHSMVVPEVGPGMPAIPVPSDNWPPPLTMQNEGLTVHRPVEPQMATTSEFASSLNLAVSCPSCLTSLQVPATLCGRTIECPSCRGQLFISASESRKPPSTMAIASDPAMPDGSIDSSIAVKPTPQNPWAARSRPMLIAIVAATASCALVVAILSIALRGSSKLAPQPNTVATEPKQESPEALVRESELDRVRSQLVGTWISPPTDGLQRVLAFAADGRYYQGEIMLPNEGLRISKPALMSQDGYARGQFRYEILAEGSLPALKVLSRTDSQHKDRVSPIARIDDAELCFVNGEFSYTRWKPYAIVLEKSGGASLGGTGVAMSKAGERQAVGKSGSEFPATSEAPFTIVKLLPSEGNLPDLLESAAKIAKDLSRVPFVEVYADWCGPCRDLRNSLSDPLMIEAFQGTYIIQLNVDEWKDKLSTASMSGSQIPAFYRIDNRGRIVGPRITGSSWGKNIPANMAPPLKAFFSTREPESAFTKPTASIIENAQTNATEFFVPVLPHFRIVHAQLDRSDMAEIRLTRASSNARSLNSKNIEARVVYCLKETESQIVEMFSLGGDGIQHVVGGQLRIVGTIMRKENAGVEYRGAFWVFPSFGADMDKLEHKRLGSPTRESEGLQEHRVGWDQSDGCIDVRLNVSAKVSVFTQEQFPRVEGNGAYYVAIFEKGEDLSKGGRQLSGVVKLSKSP